MRITIGNDHRGLALKLKIVDMLSKEGHMVTDHGAFESESVDYPEFAHSVAEAVCSKNADRGILICGTGIGMSMTANKHAGARAALCYDVDFARLTRQHNDANILCLGELNGDESNLAIVKVFLTTEFEGGRHLRRVNLIDP